MKPSCSRKDEEILSFTDFYYNDLALELTVDPNDAASHQLQIETNLEKELPILKRSVNTVSNTEDCSRRKDMDIVELLDSSVGSIEDSLK